MSMRLLDTELRRFFSRRMVLGSLVAALLLVVTINVVQFIRSTPPSSTFTPALIPGIPDECRVGVFNHKPVVDKSCVEQREPIFSGPQDAHGQPGVSVYFGDGDRRIHISKTFGGTLQGTGIAMTLLSIVLASSFLAADFGTSIGTQLMYEPRRKLVYLAKTLAVMLGCAICVLVISIGAGLLQYLGSAMRGISTGLDRHWLWFRLADLGRIMLASAFAAPLGLAIAALTKRTVAAVGILFGMMISLGFLRQTSWGAPIAKILPINGIISFASNQFGHDLGRGAKADLTSLGSAAVLCVLWAVGLTAVTLAWFSNREIR